MAAGGQLHYLRMVGIMVGVIHSTIGIDHIIVGVGIGIHIGAGIHIGVGTSPSIGAIHTLIITIIHHIIALRTTTHHITAA